MINRSNIPVFTAFLAPLLGWLAERRYRQMPALPALSTEHLPSVSIIIPARNEADNLRRLLPSLCNLEYPGRLEILVVDDNSTDDTAVVAQDHGIRVLSLNSLPQGWLGKPHACHKGTAVTSGDWLLFTDADTIHTSCGLARVLSYACENNLDGLSCHLQHTTNNWLDNIALMTAYAGLFAGLPQSHSSLNGQYILLRRDVYIKSGGFAAVRRESMEDLALGHHLHQLQQNVPLLRGEDVAQVTMYKKNTHLWRGMVRISAGSLRWSGRGGVITALFITALMSPLLVLRLAAMRELDKKWVGLTWITAVAGVWPWSKRFGPRWRVWLAPIGAIFVQLAAVWGLFTKLMGRGVRWKDRVV